MPSSPISPPPPGLEREEPEFNDSEEDIPTPSNEDPEENARHTQVHPRQP